MSNSNIDKHMTDHNYDGIKELDNPLPNWWLATFYLTIIFSIGYYYYYELSDGPTLKQELAADMEEIQQQQQAVQANKPQVDTTSLEALVGDANAIAAGKTEFAAKCASCHGNSAEGGIGPNLTDNYWIHGRGSIGDIVTVINEGVVSKGMLSWKGVIPDDKIAQVAAYIISLKGSHPAKAKAPEGELVE